jgi:hypothetical protein
VAIALSVTIPALAATTATGSTVVTGTVIGSIDITAPAPFSLGTTMIPGNGYNVSSLTGTVKCNQGWHVTATNSSGSNPGFMLVSPNGPSHLTDPLWLQMTGGSTPGSWANSSVGSTTTGAAKTGDTGTAITLTAGQLVHYSDDPGSYTISILLTATTP